MFLDAHTHVQFSAFSDDFREVIQRARDAGVVLVNVGTQRDTSRRAVELAHEFDKGVYAAVGLHPVHTHASFHDAEELGASEKEKGFTSRGEVFDREYYLSLARDPKVVAIGECGLDYYREAQETQHETREKQKQAFIAQMELAKEVGKPLMIHCRSAFPELIQILNSKFYILNSMPGIIHFFSGTPDEARELLDLGFFFTFGGVVTFARNYDEVISLIPIERILSETDAPYVTPAPYRGKRNEPFYIKEVVRKLAELKGVGEEEMASRIWENGKKIFGLSGV